MSRPYAFPSGPFIVCCALLSSIVLTSIAAGEDAKPAAAPKTHAVSRGPFQIEVTLDGTFEARDMHPIVLRPEAWSDFTVIEAVEQGKTVEQGETLVELDMTKIDQAIADIEVGQELAYLSLRQMETDVEALQRTYQLDLEAAERSDRIARESLQFFLDEDRALSEESAHQSLKSSRNYLENQLEELEQLEKMYEADDLTEETEEIILRRQRDAVESARFNLKRAESRIQRMLDVDIPRQEDSLRTSAVRSELALEKSRATLPSLFRSKQLDLAKARHQQLKSDERLEKLKADREQMKITAPVAGIVYYGQCTAGKWTTASASAAKLRQGGKLTAHNVFITIVQPGPLLVRTDVPEKDLRDARPGVEGTAAVTADPDAPLSVQVDWVSPVPTSGTNFDARLLVGLPPKYDLLVPGMTCKVTLTPYDVDDAITVPVAAVFSDDDDGKKRYVYVAKEGADHEKRSVKVGRKTDKVAEILEGLKEGEKILTSKPASNDS